MMTTGWRCTPSSTGLGCADHSVNEHDSAFAQERLSPPRLRSGAVIAASSGDPRDATTRNAPTSPLPCGVAPEAQSSSERKFASIFRLSPGAICISTIAEGRFLDANESFLRLFGYERDELIGHTAAHLGIWARSDERDPLATSCGGAGNVVNFESICQTKQGALRHVLISTEHIEIRGEPCYLGVVTDITERKEASEEVHASEKKFHQIVDIAREGIWLIDEDGRTTFANPALEEMLGYEPEEMLGKTIFEFTDAGDPAVAGARFRTLPLQVAPRSDVKYRRKDGTDLWAQVVSTPLRDDAGAYQGALVMVTDITERKLAEKRREEYASLLMATLEASADGILATDRGGNVTSYNQKFVQLFHVPDDVRTGALERGLSFLSDHSSNPEAYLARVQAIYALTDQESEDTLELTDGRTFECRSQPQWISGLCVGRVWSFRDVTQQREIMARLLATDRLASMGALAAGVGHEINNPLAYVVANLGFLAEDLPQLVSTLSDDRACEVLECLHDAQEGAERVRQIVRDLKVFSRVDDVENTPVDLERVLELAVSMAGNEIRHRARLVRDYHAIPLVQGNEGRLGQVFLNLIVNAAQSIREGNVAGSEIRIVTRSDPGGEVRVEIHDTGAGIPAELLQRIFVPFFTTKPVGKGTGLGLSICNTIIESAGGRLTVESEVGKGTVFRVFLPVSSPDRLDAPEPRARLSSGCLRGRVLIVDDEELVGGALRRLLGREHDVTLVTSGRAALDYLASGAPVDVILCDLMMPAMTGIDVHEELSRTAPHHAARMVFLTGGAFTARARDFLDTVPNERVEKPFDSAALRALVRKAVRG
ncbi:MAG: PAS domain S-box protein [Byssovorax sp.]